MMSKARIASSSATKMPAPCNGCSRHLPSEDCATQHALCIA
jgi:hypothetical protein